MKTATIKDIQSELENLTKEEQMALCLRLARFKKENKELLTYLLFEAFDEQGYINNVKDEISMQLQEMNSTNLYFVKKSIRKIVRMIAKYSRYTGSANVEVQLLIHFCSTFKNSGIRFTESQVLVNIYQHQIKKIEKLVASFHEDLQYDFYKELKTLAISE